MVLLSPLYRSKLYVCATDALDAALDEARDDSASATENLHELIAAVASAVQTAVNEACTDFLERFNDLYPDPLRRLPTEVLLECFRLLDFDGRVAVSHVSRAWRQVSLADKHLWTEVSLGFHTQFDVTKLSVLLSRSEPLPFHLTWNAFPASNSSVPDIFQLILEHIDRLQFLEFQNPPPDTLGQIFAHPAVLLRDLIIGNRGRPCVLPKRWGAERAPLFRRLDTAIFAVPEEFEPISSLRHFEGELASDAPIDIGLPRLFTIFPCLVSLRLRELTNESLALLPALPPTLATVDCSAKQGVHLDFTAFLRDRTGHAHLEFSAQNVANLLAVIDVFAAKTPGTWDMAVSSRQYTVTLKGADNGLVYHLFHFNRRIDRWWDTNSRPFRRALDRLASLTVSVADLVSICYDDTPVWDRTLHSLCALIITCDLVGDCIAANCLISRTARTPLRAPRLDSVSLRLDTVVLTENQDAETCDFVAAFATLLPLLITYSTRLSALSITADNAGELRDEDIAGLSRLARRLQTKDNSTGELIVDILDADASADAESDCVRSVT